MMANIRPSLQQGGLEESFEGILTPGTDNDFQHPTQAFILIRQSQRDGGAGGWP